MVVLSQTGTEDILPDPRFDYEAPWSVARCAEAEMAPAIIPVALRPRPEEPGYAAFVTTGFVRADDERCTRHFAGVFIDSAGYARPVTCSGPASHLSAKHITLGMVYVDTRRGGYAFVRIAYEPPGTYEVFNTSLFGEPPT